MSDYIGDFTEDATLNFKFTTVSLAQVPTTLAGTPVIKVYKDDATTTESTAGITLTVDFDSVTGLNNVEIDLSSDAFYATGADYQVVITTGTVDSISVVGTVVREFSIQNRFSDADNVWDEAIEGSLTARQLMRINSAILSGKVSGATTGANDDVLEFLAADGTTVRATATVDKAGNRTILVLNGA